MITDLDTSRSTLTTDCELELIPHMITAEDLLDCLGKPAQDPFVHGALVALGLPSEPPEIEDDVSTDLLATEHGVAVFFMTAHHLRNHSQVAGQPTDTAVLSQVTFSAKGFRGGPGFAGALPYGLTFSDSRAAVRERLGDPTWTSPLGIPNDRWTFGERFLTLDFSKDESRIKKLTCGVSWML